MKEQTMCHQDCPAPVRGGSGIVEESVETPAADRAIPGFLARPDGDTPSPAVVIIHDIWGENPFYHDLARRLAGEGFVTLLPDLFIREGPLAEQTREQAFARRARHDQVRALSDIAAAIQWLADNQTTTGAVGTIGFCMGGTLAMLAAAREPVPDATVAFYGFPASEPTERAPLQPLAEANMVRSPMLCLWGDQDHGVGMDKVEAYRAALAEADRPVEMVIYPGPGHAFLTFDPTAPYYDEAQDAWQRTLTFLREELSGA
jgi:carboxymethylenebutenolidase